MSEPSREERERWAGMCEDEAGHLEQQARAYDDEGRGKVYKTGRMREEATDWRSIASYLRSGGSSLGDGNCDRCGIRCHLCGCPPGTVGRTTADHLVANRRTYDGR